MREEGACPLWLSQPYQPKLFFFISPGKLDSLNETPELRTLRELSADLDGEGGGESDDFYDPETTGREGAMDEEAAVA